MTRIRIPLFCVVFFSVLCGLWCEESQLTKWRTCSIQEARQMLTNGFDVDSTDENGWSAILYTVRYNQNPDITKILIEAGADINKANLLGWTPLLYAAQYDSSIVGNVSLLLAAGADINVRTPNGWTPLMQASRFNKNPQIISELLKHGASINSRNEEGKSALILAAAFNKPEIVEVLLNAGASCDIIDDNFKNAFDYAKENIAIKGTPVYWILCDKR